MLVQALITKAPVEGFDVGVLIGLAWLNQKQLHSTLMSPGQHGPATELLAIVRVDGLGQSSRIARRPRMRVKECPPMARYGMMAAASWEVSSTMVRLLMTRPSAVLIKH